jgi:hypothetical protein
MDTFGLMSRVPKGLFTETLDAFANRWLKNVEPVNEVEMRRVGTRHLLDVTESLIISPRTTFKIYGENVVVPMLVDTFGLEGVEQLLEEEAIDFILWREMITVMDDDQVLSQGIHPLQSGVLNSAAHSEPSASAELGMRWNKKIGPGDARRLAKKVAARTRLPPNGVAMMSLGAVSGAYADGRLKPQGFESAVEPWRISAQQRKQLHQLASDTMTAAVLLNEELDLYGSDNAWNALMTMLKRISAQGGVFESVEEVFKLERLPSIQDLLLKKVITWKDVLRVRNLPETHEFRAWLWEQSDPMDSAGVAERYFVAMAPNADRGSPTLRKVGRISAVSIAGSALGTLVGGPLGGAAGFGVGTVLGTAVSLIDGLFVDKVAKKKNPRRFATDVLGPMMAMAAKAKTNSLVKRP